MSQSVGSNSTTARCPGPSGSSACDCGPCPALCLQIGTVKEPELRVQIVSERSTFDEDPAAFHKRYAEKQVRHKGACMCSLGKGSMCCCVHGVGQAGVGTLLTGHLGHLPYPACAADMGWVLGVCCTVLPGS